MRLEDVRREIRRALDNGNLKGAGAFAELAINRGDKDPMVYCLASSCRAEAGDARAAVHFARRAAQLAPGNAVVLTTVADALRNAGEPREAAELFERALAIDPRMLAAWYGRALACESSGDIAAAVACYVQVTQLAPGDAPGFAGLASMQAQLGDIVSARRNAEAARQRDACGTSTLIALARCDLAEGDAERAASRLRPLLDRPPAGFDGVIAMELLGDAMDRLDRVDEAFAAYSVANLQFARMNPDLGSTAATTDIADAFHTWLKANRLPNAPESAHQIFGEAAQHVFVLGFPRSGTTLVEQIIGTVEHVSTLEEAPTLAAAQDRYLTPDGLDRLSRANAYELSRCRAAYWSQVRDRGLDVRGGMFVDMDPFKSVSLPLIARLFPRAKIVVVRRDPRDVIWSCFRRNFVLSHATSQFTSLDRAARLYIATSKVIESSLAELPLDAHIVRYEDLVHDFDITTQALFRFLGLEWSPNVRNFPEGARRRYVSTASAYQVRRGLFNGTGQWRRYARHLEPAVKVLQEEGGAIWSDLNA